MLKNKERDAISMLIDVEFEIKIEFLP
jgi:hypothetical protein